ncbi:MAG: tetratricopeptide repeat protein [Ktedonobacteraceae bacterium]
MGKRLGLFVGINKYQDPTFQSLHYAETDAKALAHWLIDPRGGAWNATDAYVTAGLEATKERLEAQLMQLCVHAANPEDLIFIYFAGHAFVDDTGGEGYLAGSNTIYSQPTSAIHVASLVRQAMVSSRAAQVVLMLDCFQTGTAWNQRRTSPFDFQPLIGPTLQQVVLQSQGRIVYCSCRGNNLAPEVGEKGLGAALYRAIVGLSGPAKDPATGQITLQQLYAHTINKSDMQHQPQIYGQETRPIVLVGELPVFAPAVSSLSAMRTSASSTGQFTYQGVGESGPLVEQSAPYAGAAMTGQLSPSTSTSGQLSLSVLEMNRKQQCMKLVLQARQAIQMQNIPEALGLVEQVLQMNPSYVDALTLKGQILGSTGRFQEAIATVEQLLQIDPNNALAWSMQAALLMNTGRPLDASSAIERSIALDPQNPEAQAIRDSIQASLMRPPDNTWQPQTSTPQSAPTPTRDSAKSFLLGAALQIFALILGCAGAAILVLQPHLPILIGFVLESLGLALLCILAARGAFLYGVGRLLFTILLCLVSAGILGGIYKFGYTILIHKVAAFPPLIVPVLFLAFWLIAAAVVPFLLGIGGFIGGLALGVRRKQRG